MTYEVFCCSRSTHDEFAKRRSFYAVFVWNLTLPAHCCWWWWSDVENYRFELIMKITQTFRSGQIIAAGRNCFQFPAFEPWKKNFILLILNAFKFYLQYDNVEACLNILRQNSVPGVENITTNDIIGGRLKAVLSLFFSLSRYKQASKLKAPSNRSSQSQLNHTQSDMMLAKERWVSRL